MGLVKSHVMSSRVAHQAVNHEVNDRAAHGATHIQRNAVSMTSGTKDEQ